MKIEFLNKMMNNRETSLTIVSRFDKTIEEVEDKELLTYILRSDFLKRSYNGKFKHLNDTLLDRKELLYKMTNAGNYRQLRTEMRDCLGMEAVFNLWGEYKQVYTFDEDFAGELIQTDNIYMPISVFHNLPYKCFYIDLDNISLFPNYFGCFVYVSLSPETGLPSIIMMRCTKEKGVENELFFSSYIFEHEMVHGGLIEEKKGEENSGASPYDNIFLNFKKDYLNCDKITLLVTRQDAELGAKPIYDDKVREFCLFILQAILYIGSYSPDIKKRDYNVRNLHKLEKAGEKPVTVCDVGYKWGETIRKERVLAGKRIETPGKNESTGNRGSHSPKSSHVRRSHWHTYRVGEGRKNTIVRWLPPIYVVGNKNAEVPITVHKVKK